MSDEVVFYHNPQSRSGMVHWMLEEVGAPYRVVPVGFDDGELTTRCEAFLRINPMGKIPTIVHKGVTVTETAAICLYLADAFPDAGLAPAVGSPERGTYYRWMVFPASVFEPALLDVFLKRDAPPKRTAGYGSYEDALNGFRAALSNGPYILGDKFSAADVYVGSELRFGTMFGAPGLKDEPLFQDYIARLDAREAYKRTQGQ